MKIFTYFSPTHKILFENYFKPSIEKFNELELHYKESEKQECKGGGYFDYGFKKETTNKIKAICSFMAENISLNEYFVYSDVDIVFLNKIEYYLQEYKGGDITFQQDGVGGCNCGFMLIKKTASIISLFEKIIVLLEASSDETLNDQIVLNRIINNEHFCFFDEKIYHYGMIENKIWNVEDFKLPSNCKVFHACYCSGIENKIKLLDKVLNNG
jgi:hypothetical protein